MRKNIVFISGVSREKTPILNNMISDLEKSFNCIFILYEGKNIFSFIRFSLYNIFKINETEAIFFVGIQSLPVLFLAQFLSIKKYYWALENYKFKLFNSSLVQKTVFIENIIYWKKIILISPSKYRAEYYKNKFKSILIIENTHPLGTSFKRRIITEEKVKFVMYGRLCNNDIYLSEFIDIIGKHQYFAELHLIGWDFLLEEKIKPFSNIFFHGHKQHSELLKLLDDYHISIIGYRPYSFNNKYCAPNKLYEALSLSLPIIGNNLNPPLVEIIKEEECGILSDFSAISDCFEEILNNIHSNFYKYNKSSYNAYIRKYHFKSNIEKTIL